MSCAFGTDSVDTGKYEGGQADALHKVKESAFPAS